MTVRDAFKISLQEGRRGFRKLKGYTQIFYVYAQGIQNIIFFYYFKLGNILNLNLMSKNSPTGTDKLNLYGIR